MQKLILALGLASMALPAHAEDARSLPAGRSRVSFLYAKTNGISQKFNDQGIEESITKPYNMNLDAAAIGAFANSVSPQFGNLIGLLNDTGLRYDAAASGTPSGGVTATDPSKPLLGEALTKGFLGIDVEATQTQSVFQYMHGVTDRLSVGFVIPIVTNRVRASASINQVNNTVADYTRAFQGMGSGFTDIVNGLQFLDTANIESLQTLALENNGYKRFGSSEQSGVGDVNFGGRFNYLKTPKENWINSFQLSFSAPTGKTHAPSAIAELDHGTGVWDIAAAHITNFTPGGSRSPWMFSNGIHYTHRLPGKKIMRVRNDPSDFLPNASTEEEIQLRYASKVWTTLAARYTLNSVMSFESSYELYWKGRDTFQGSREKDYTYLSAETETYLETLNLNWSISMIEAYSAKQFPLPMDFSLNYYRPVSGRNFAVAPYITAEAALYF